MIFSEYIATPQTSTRFHKVAHLVPIYYSGNDLFVGNNKLALDGYISSVMGSDVLTVIMGDECIIMDLAILSSGRVSVRSYKKLTLIGVADNAYSESRNKDFLVVYTVGGMVYSCYTKYPSLHYCNGSIASIDWNTGVIVDNQGKSYKPISAGQFRIVNDNPAYSIDTANGYNMSIPSSSVMSSFYYRNLLVIVDRLNNVYKCAGKVIDYVGDCDSLLLVYDTNYARYSNYCSYDKYLLQI